MGMCKPSGGIKSVYGPARKNIRERTSDFNSRIDYYDEKTGELLQQRWFGPNGYAIWDRDWKHGDAHHNHFFPHDHSWDWSKKVPRDKKFQKPNQDYC